MGDRILVIASHAPSLLGFRRALIERLVEEGHEVHAAAPSIGEGAVAERLEAMGVTPHDYPLQRTGLDPIADLRTLRVLRSLIARLRPDVTLAYTIKPVIYGTIAAAIAGVRRRVALITGLGYAFTGEARGKRRVTQWIARTLYRAALSKAHRVIFQNPDDAALFAQLGLVHDRANVRIVDGSGVDLAEYPPQPLPDGPPSFLLIARLLTAKGIREYAAAAASLKADHPDASFLLVGPHDSNPDAIDEAELKQWQAAGAIEWLGSRRDVRPELAAAHVFVLPSYREGTPRSTLEALATGRAIVTTDAPGCRETVEEGRNGFLVPVADAEALAEAMRRFIVDPSLCATMGEASLALARRRYDVHKVNDAMLDHMGLSR